MKCIASLLVCMLSLSLIHAQEIDTSLHSAVWNNDLNQVKSLVEGGYYIETKNDNNYTALYIACLTNNSEIAAYLIDNGADLENHEYYDESPVDISIKNNYLSLFKVICDHVNSDDESNSPLIKVVDYGNLPMLRFMVEEKKFDTSNKEILAELLSSAASFNQPDIIKYLVNTGADINYSLEYQGAAIHSAASTGSPETIKLLLELGANPNMADQYEYSPLEMAISYNKPENVLVLLSVDTKIIKDTAYTLSVIDQLCSYQMVEPATRLINQIGDFSTYCSKQWNPLIGALKMENLELAELLISKRLDINSKNDNGETPLLALAKNMDYYDTSIFLNLSRQKYLLTKGANPNTTDDNGYSAFLALNEFNTNYTEAGSIRDSLHSLILFYLTKDADILLENSYGSSAYSVSDEELKQEFRKILEKKMVFIEPEEIWEELPGKSLQLWGAKQSVEFGTGEEIDIPSYFYLLFKSTNPEPWTEKTEVEDDDEDLNYEEDDSYSNYLNDYYSEEEYKAAATSSQDIMIAQTQKKVSILNIKNKRVLFSSENRFDSASALVLGDKILLYADSAYYLTDVFFTRVEHNTFTDFLTRNRLIISPDQQRVNMNKHILFVHSAKDNKPILLQWDEGFNKVKQIDISAWLSEINPDSNFICFSADGNWVLVGESSSGSMEYETKRLRFSIYHLNGSENISFSKRINIGLKSYSDPTVISTIDPENKCSFRIKESSSYGQHSKISFEKADSLIGVTDEFKPLAGPKTCAFSSALVRKYLKKEKSKKLLSLLKTLESPDVIGDEGYTLLHLAIRANKPEMVQLLIDNGCNVNTPGVAGITPLYLAALLMDNEKIVEYLLENGADIKTLTVYGANLAFPATYFSFSNYLLPKLQEKNVDLWQQDNMGRTPLYIAIKRQKPYFDYDIFFRDGISLQTPCFKQSSPLLTAIKEKNPWALSYLLSKNGTDLNYAAGNDNTPLIQAMLNEEPSLANYLVYNGADVNKSTTEYYPLGLSVINYYDELTKLLISRGANIHKTNEQGSQPIHYAAQQDNADLIKLLLEKGANIEAVDSAYNTPLLIAVLNQASETADVLLAGGANPNYADTSQCTIIYYAAGVSEQLAKKLLEAGANPMIKSKDGVLPLQNAFINTNFDAAILLLDDKYKNEYPDSLIKSLIFLYTSNNYSAIDTTIIQALLEKGGEINYTGNEYYNILDGMLAYGLPEDILFIISNGFDLYQSNNLTVVPMQKLFESGIEEEDLLKIIKNLDNPGRIIEPDSLTLLHLAAKNNKSQVITYLTEEFPEMINMKDIDGNTPLHFAAGQYYSDEGIIQQLIDAGADTTILNKSGLTCFELRNQYDGGDYEEYYYDESDGAESYEEIVTDDLEVVDEGIIEEEVEDEDTSN